MFFVFGLTEQPNRCWIRKLNFLSFFCLLILPLCLSMMATYLQERMKSKNHKNDLDFCHSERHLFLRGAIDARFFSISSLMNACSIVGLCCTRKSSMQDRTNLGIVRCAIQAFKKAVDNVKARNFHVL